MLYDNLSVEPAVSGQRAEEEKEGSCSSDEELLLQVQKGDAEAFTVLVHQNEKDLLRYLSWYLGNAHLAEDVLQNTFLTVHQKIHTHERGKPLRPWLYTIATHKAIDALRKEKRHCIMSLDVHPNEQEEGDDPSTPTFRGLIEGEGENPSVALETAEELEQLRKAVSSLPSHLCSLVDLAYYQGLTYCEIAKILGIPLGTVKSRISAAKGHLRNSLENAEA
jgi:RNA polymerase sigma-70 factor (ECF subfamily)